MTDALIQIDFTNTLSYQVQIRNKLIQLIQLNIFGCKALPSTRKLASILGVSRNTVTQVYQSLIDEQYLESKERKGVFINEAYQTSQKKLTIHTTNTTSGSIKNTTIESNTPKWNDIIVRKPSQHARLDKDKSWMNYTYSFVYGQISSEDFPVQQWRNCSRWTQGKHNIQTWLDDSIDADDSVLIEQIQQTILPCRGVYADTSQLLVSLGTQNSLYMLSNLLVNANITVGIEDPGYVDFRNILHQSQANIIPLAVDEEGLILSDQLQHCDIVFVTPSHQYPTSVTMSLDRRKQLLEMANQHNFIIIEDDYDSEVDFSAVALPALKSLDTNNRVIYLGSLSKSLSPGLRMGYICADECLIKELKVIRRLNYRHPPTNNQRTAALFIAQGFYTSHIRRMQTIYKHKWQTMKHAFDALLPFCKVTSSSGSFCFWIRLPKGLDGAALCQSAAQHNIYIESGDNLFINKEHNYSYLRLGYSTIAQNKIMEGIQKLKQLIMLEVENIAA